MVGVKNIWLDKALIQHNYFLFKWYPSKLKGHAIIFGLF
jgi:hypothetical protein